MKKTFILGFTVLLLAGLFALACNNNGEENKNEFPASLNITVSGNEVITSDFSIIATLDKKEAKVGDKITATVVFKNLSDRDIEAELPDWIAYGGGSYKEDILHAYLLPEGVELSYISIAVHKRPEILIESGAVIERQFEIAVTEPGNFALISAAYFVDSDGNPPYGMQINSTVIIKAVK